MIRTRILFFGATADVVGSRCIEFDFTEGTKAADTLTQIVRHFPALAAHGLRLSINQQYASGSERIENGDELAVFTAVSGG